MVALICIGMAAITPTRTIKGGVKPLLMQFGTAKDAGADVMAIMTRSGTRMLPGVCGL